MARRSTTPSPRRAQATPEGPAAPSRGAKSIATSARPRGDNASRRPRESGAGCVYREQAHDAGAFEVSSGLLVAMDPCWSGPDDKALKGGPSIGLGLVRQARSGLWRARLVVRRYLQPVELGARVAELWAVHEHAGPLGAEAWSGLDAFVGVDSGHAGIFDQARLDACKEAFQRHVDDRRDDPVVLLPGGIFCASGFGDGGYNALVARHGDEAVGVRLIFIDEAQEQTALKVFGLAP